MKKKDSSYFLNVKKQKQKNKKTHLALNRENP